jgi:cell division protein FtsL
MDGPARVASPLSLNSVRLWFWFLLIIVLFGVAYLGQASQATLMGQRLHDLQDRLDRIEQENAQLDYEIATLMSPDKIEARARALGLRPATNAQIRFLVITDYPGPVRPTPAAPNAAAGQASGRRLDPGVVWNGPVGGVDQWFNPPSQVTTNP